MALTWPGGALHPRADTGEVQFLLNPRPSELLCWFTSPAACFRTRGGREVDMRVGSPLRGCMKPPPSGYGEHPLEEAAIVIRASHRRFSCSSMSRRLMARFARERKRPCCCPGTLIQCGCEKNPGQNSYCGYVGIRFMSVSNENPMRIENGAQIVEL